MNTESKLNPKLRVRRLGIIGLWIKNKKIKHPGAKNHVLHAPPPLQ